MEPELLRLGAERLRLGVKLLRLTIDSEHPERERRRPAAD